MDRLVIISYDRLQPEILAAICNRFNPANMLFLSRFQEPNSMQLTTAALSSALIWLQKCKTACCICIGIPAKQDKLIMTGSFTVSSPKGHHIYLILTDFGLIDDPPRYLYKNGEMREIEAMRKYSSNFVIINTDRKELSLLLSEPSRAITLKQFKHAVGTFPADPNQDLFFPIKEELIGP